MSRPVGRMSQVAVLTLVLMPRVGVGGPLAAVPHLETDPVDPYLAIEIPDRGVVYFYFVGRFADVILFREAALA